MSIFKKVLSVFLTIIMIFTTVLSIGMIAHATMLPIDEIKAYLILNGKTNEELTALNLNEVLSMLVDSDGNPITIPSDATTVWRYVKSEEDGLEEYRQYNILQNEVIDLSVEPEIKTYTLELIIGSVNQLDSKNIRYNITVYITDTIQEEIGYELYLQDANGIRSKVTPERTSSAVNTQIYDIIANEWAVPEPENGSQYYLNISSIADEHPNVRVEVYSFSDYVLLSTNATTITSKVLHQNMQQNGSGLPINYGQENVSMFALVYFDKNGQVINQYFVSFAAVKDSAYINANLYQKINGELTDIVMLDVDHIGFKDTDSILRLDGVHELCLMLKEGYSLGEETYCVLDAHGDTYGDDANSYVKKAVVGHYNTYDEASECEDIKDQLIPSDKLSLSRGYKANYDYEEGGMPFTVFFEDGSVFKINVLAMQYDSKYDEGYVRSFTEDPIIGEADPWLRVKGAENSNSKKYDTYVVENGKNINMDTYYGYGYQTIFINDANADLSNIKPEFWYANTDRVYAVDKNTGNRIDEEHIRDFSNENQQYTGIIVDNDKENERNYWVTFKKLNNNGPELYVFGPNAREVILDEYFEFKHDILIANIGNAPLKDINVELLDAENVKLDPYWNVGGNGNDTLAAFTTTSNNTKYGELPNLAKIRLLPDGEGEVKGTLKITAQGQKPVLITLNGKAQNPEVITEKLSDAVKYVPYQQIVATNNMHDWITTQFSIVDGALPDGVTLNSDTGEIYGVPTVPDKNENATYKFTVKANYYVDGRDGYFEPSLKEFTLTVKPNTDENVYLASDINDGYSIKQHIGTQIGQYSFELKNIEDTVFTSNGEYGEFVALYLNGEKLVDGIDYDSESGSTKITIKSQTMSNKTKPNVSNTIAMEFRKDTNNDGKGDSGADMNRTSQNYTHKVETAVDSVIKKIAALPSSITLKDKGSVQSARNTYEALSSADKMKVTNYSKLTDAEATIARLEKEEADKAVVNKVITLIGDLPEIITLNEKQNIVNARNAYNGLISSQQKNVTNYDRLIKAEDAIKQLEKNENDRAMANNVVSLINSIPNPITLDSKSAVTAARNAYNMLTADQKRFATNYDKLQEAENIISELESDIRDQAKVDSVIATINAIPSKLTLADKTTVKDARDAYNNLPDNLKSKVVNYNDLTNAEARIEALEAQEFANKADKNAADTVIALIDTIPKKITLADKDKIQAVRSNYDKLSNTQKALVANYNELTAAEAEIKILEDYEEAAKKDKIAVDKVSALIEAIPSNITLDDIDSVTVARNAYDALTDNQKGIVTNYDKLTAAEVKIAELKDENYEEIQSVTFVGIFVDKDGKALSDVIVEIHSVVQTGRTDENGSFQFNDVEFGKHIIYVKDSNGNITSQKEFNIVIGSPLELNGNSIIVESGSVFTVKMQVDNAELSFLSVENGNKTPIVDTNKDDNNSGGINIGAGNVTSNDKDTNHSESIPQTNDDINIMFWFALLIVSICGLSFSSYSKIKQRKKSDK